MAKKLSKSGIVTSQTVQSWHVSQSIDALTGTEAYDITLSGSLNITGSVLVGVPPDLVALGTPGIEVSESIVIHQNSGDSGLFWTDYNNPGLKQFGVQYSGNGLNFWTPWGSDHGSKNYLMQFDCSNARVGINTNTPASELEVVAEDGFPGTITAATGSFSHISGSSPLTIEADNWSVNESGNLRFVRARNTVINGDDGNETIDLGSEDLESWVMMRNLISVDLRTDGSNNGIIFKLPLVEAAYATGASITIVVQHDASTHAGLFFQRADGDDSTVIVTRIACYDYTISFDSSDGVGIEAGAAKKGDQFTLTCDGVRWYVNGIISAVETQVTSIP